MRKSPGSLASEAFSSSSSSLSNSYSDASDLANWEEYVAADGSLFYVEYLKHEKAAAGAAERRVEFMRRSLRLGKKSSRRQQQHSNSQSQNQSQSQSQGQNQSHNQSQLDSQAEPQEFRFSQFKTAAPDPKKLELVITAADRFRFGRRSTAVESILGFRVLPFPDQPECLMVDGFVHDLSALQHGIKRGDWFRSLNGIELYASNVDELLQQFVEPTQVCLGFQSCSSGNAASPADPSFNAQSAPDEQQVCKVENFAAFAEKFEKMLLPEAETSPDMSLPFAMLLLPPECYQHEQQQDSLYYYPETPDNFLFKARGSFLTLHAVLSELHTQPLSSRLLVEQVPYHVNYRRLNGFLVLFAYAGALCSAAECSLRSDELIGYIRFSLPGLVLESFSSEGGTASSSSLKLFLRHFCGIQRTRLVARCRAGHIRFEELLGQSRSLPLPKEAQLRIFDALSEMEAMDYRNWNDEPLTTHREFFIYGSALYYDGFLVASLLPPEVRVSVEGFLRCRGIFDLLGAPGIRVRELYVWEEIVLPSATGRYFLTVCTRNHLSLAVILKIFDAPDMAPDAVVGPSLFYIEEIQETLDHLVQCGIESLAMFWSISNKRPEVLEATGGETRDQEKESSNSRLESFLKQKLTVLSPAVEEEAQLCSSLGGSSIHSLTPSEDDSSRRRLTPIHGAAGEDSDSGSDWENFAVQHPLHYGLNLGTESHNQSQMTESMWKEINNVVPVKISAGWKNSVLHYVYIDIANGSLFAPFNDSSDTGSSFLSEIRQACHIIHAVLEKSKHYRRQLTESSRAQTNANGHGSSSTSVSLVKEHGMTLEVQSPQKAEQSQSSRSSRFVVVGRLFQSPAKEVYVCHRSDVPQNIVEMAFRLSFFSMG